MPIENPDPIQYAEDPDTNVTFSRSAASEMAAATAIASGRQEDFDRYREAFQSNGYNQEWKEFQVNYNYASDTNARGRVVNRLKQKAADLGLPVNDADMIEAAAPEVEGSIDSKEDALTPGVMAAGLRHAASADDNQETRDQLQYGWDSFDQFKIDQKASQDEVSQIAGEYFAQAGSDAPLVSGAKAVGSITADTILPTDTAIMAYAAHKIGVPVHYFAGENMVAISDYFKSLPPDQVGPKFKELVTAVGSIPGVGNFKAYGTMAGIANLDTGKIGTSLIDRALADFGSALDPIAIGGLFRSTSRAIRSLAGTLTAKTLIRTAPKAGKQFMGMVLNDIKSSPLNNTWNLAPETVAGTQLPKPRLPIGRDNIPDGVIEAAERVAVVKGDISNITASARSNLFTPDEVLTSVQQKGRDIEEANKGKIRPALSQIKVHTDGTAVDFHTMLGRTNDNGFVTYTQASRRAEELKQMGEDIKIFKVDKSGSLVEATKAEKGTGDYYVELKQTHYVRPEDKAIFGGDPIAGNSWLGAAGRWVLPPSSEFHPEIYKSFLDNTLKESALTSKLQQIAAPIFRDLNAGDRVDLSKMWTWTEDFGRKEARIPNYNELIEAFPDAKPSVVRGWYQTKMFYDTVYDMNNQRLYRDWASRGFKTYRGGGVAYHGMPVARQHAPLSVLDPVTNQTRSLSSKELDGIYDQGGTVLRLDTAVEGTGDNLHSYVIADNAARTAGWALKPLDKNVLKYIPGYYPRIYKDYHFVQRTSTSVVDGVAREHTAGVTIARTRQEAEVMAERLNAKNTTKGTSYSVGADSRLSGRDRTAQDLDRLRTEGRLFFDERNQTKMFDVYGNPAEIVDPMNMLSRTSRMVGRQVAMEDLIKAQKTSWKATFGDLVKGDFERMTGSAVQAELGAIQKSADATASKRANAAGQWWDYIRLMEGTNPETQIFKRQAIQAAEWLNNLVKKVPGGRNLMAGAVRGAHNVNPVQWMKGLAYFDFLTTRPVRQLILQGSQSLFVAPLLAGRPKLAPYLARWHLDSTWLMQGAKRRGLAESGGKTMTNGLVYRNAKLMGYTKEEYLNLVEHFENSGLLQSVNIHSFAGDLPAATGHIPTTKLGAAASQVVRPLGAARDFLNKGFDLGEQFNLSASYMAALKIYMHDGKIAKLSGLGEADWKAIGAKASDMALSMNRANASKYQFGLLSIPTQFLSFTHKATMVGLKAATFGKLGPKTMNVGDAYKILAGQFIMFGGAGFGIKPEVENLMSESGFSQFAGTEVSDIVAGGILDHVLDKSLQAISDDKDLDLAFDEFLAPGGNIINVARKFMEAWSEGGMQDAVFGPSATPIGNIGQAINLASMLAASDDIPLSPGEKANVVADAFLSGVAAGYNDFVQARTAAHANRWVSQSGVESGVQAKWEEIVARGLIGLSPESRLDSFHVTSDMHDHEQAIKQTAQDYYSRSLNLIHRWTNGELDTDQLRTKLAVEKVMLSGLEEFERNAVQKEYNKLVTRDRGPKSGLEYEVARFLTNGVPPTQAMRDKLAKTTAITDEVQREALLNWIDQIIAEQPQATRLNEETLDRELDKAQD